MHWLDVAGPPGSGKSTICNPLWGHKAIAGDAHCPDGWKEFFEEIGRLLNLVRPHPSYDAAVRMNMRSFRKMAHVLHIYIDDIYIQTGFIQRGLGFGWRLYQMGKPIEETRRFFELMPVSLGAAFLTANPETIIARNKERLKNPETAHEDRSFMVPLMLPAIAFAKSVLADRGVPFIEVDVECQTPQAARQQLLDFAQRVVHAAA